MNYDKYKNTVDGTADLKAWLREESRILEMFEYDLSKEYGVSDHPKRGKLYAKAWAMGHANGLPEIEHYYSELVELIL